MKTILSAFAFLAFSLSAHALVSLNERTEAAVAIVQAIQSSSRPIPQEVLNKCKGVAIIKVTRAGFVVGGQGGQGVVLKRQAKPWGSSWSAPFAFTLAGGSFGAQIGGETQQVVFVLNTEAAVNAFTGEGKTTWEALAGGTGGTLSDGVSASTLDELPVRVYRTSAGAYGGATFGGSSVNGDREANRAAYGTASPDEIFAGKAKKAPSATERLHAALKGK